MKVYFECGRLVNHLQLPVRDAIYVDAADGIISNRSILDALAETRPDAVIYTNSAVALNSEYCWNSQDHLYNVYIRSGEDFTFKQIGAVIYEDFNEGSDLFAEILEYYI